MTVRSWARNSATCREWVRLTRSSANWLIFALATLQLGQAQTKLTVLHRFSGGADGGEPFAPLVRDSAGNLYGTTVLGGMHASGVIFRISPTDTFTPLYSFTGGNDGAFLYAGVVLDRAGNLYGAANSGGKRGYGTVFELSPSGTLTVLYSFTGGSDGGNPNGVIRDSTGNLYGTASEGGIGGISGYGTVFKISNTGVFKVLYRFTGGADGAYPFAPLVLDSKGNLYGTALTGGSTGGNCGFVGCGVVFKLDKTGTETVLYSFLGGADGGNPDTPLVVDSTGNLFGITPSGGSFSGVCGNGNTGCGVVFEVDTSNTETVLHTFTGNPDGEYPQGGLLLEEAAHTLYGATNNGGTNSLGTVFKVDTSSNTETVLHNFTGTTDGEFPEAGIIRDKVGNLYSTSSGGGASAPTKCCRGTAYRLGKQ